MTEEMTDKQRISLTVVSLAATLEQLLPVLGESDLKHHDLGAKQGNGLIYQQTVWFRRVVGTGEIEDLLDETLEWLSSRKADLVAIDPSAFLKIICYPADGGLAISPSVSQTLANLGVLLLVETERAAGEA